VFSKQILYSFQKKGKNIFEFLNEDSDTKNDSGSEKGSSGDEKEKPVKSAAEIPKLAKVKYIT
jgi:hypothetical protein